MKQVEVQSFKMPFGTHLFNKNQRVWIATFSGALAYKVVGRHRGKHRYIAAWISFDNKEREKFVKCLFEKFYVDKEFADRHGIFYLDNSMKEA